MPHIFVTRDWFWIPIEPGDTAAAGYTNHPTTREELLRHELLHDFLNMAALDDWVAGGEGDLT